MRRNDLYNIVTKINILGYNNIKEIYNIMPEVVSYKERLKCVYVDSFNEVGMEDVQNSLKEVSKLLKKNQSDKLIVDVRKQIQTLELFETAIICKELIKELPRTLKIGYITQNPPMQSHSFFTLMSESLGHPVQPFFTIKDALRWMEGKSNLNDSFSRGKVKFPSNLEG